MSASLSLSLLSSFHLAPSFNARSFQFSPISRKIVSLFTVYTPRRVLSLPLLTRTSNCLMFREKERNRPVLPPPPVLSRGLALCFSLPPPFRPPSPRLQSLRRWPPRHSRSRRRPHDYSSGAEPCRHVRIAGSQGMRAGFIPRLSFHLCCTGRSVGGFAPLWKAGRSENMVVKHPLPAPRPSPLVRLASPPSACIFVGFFSFSPALCSISASL